MESHFKISILSLLLCFSIVSAETGMGLVVCTVGGYDKEGSIRRIDVSNSRVTLTTSAIGTGYCPRFSPDGNGFAYLTGNTVKVCDLNGQLTKSFAVAGGSVSNLSYTTKGIYVAGGGAVRLYNPATGFLISQVSQPNGWSGRGYVSQNGTVVTSTEDKGGGQWTVGIHNLSSGSGFFSNSGCSAGPSPNGALCTNNLWESGVEHRTMNILNTSNGSASTHLDIGVILGLGTNWSWNRQCWSGNSGSIIILPVGGWGNQFNNFCEPWIYNINTEEAIRLANRSNSGDFWQPYDYYSGKNPGSSAVTPAMNRPTADGIVIAPGPNRSMLIRAHFGNDAAQRKVMIYDARGTVIDRIAFVGRGAQEARWSGLGLQSGIYFIGTQGSSAQSKFMIVR